MPRWLKKNVQLSVAEEVPLECFFWRDNPEEEVEVFSLLSESMSVTNLQDELQKSQ